LGGEPILAKRPQMVLYPFATGGGDVCYIARINHLSRLWCNKRYKTAKGMKQKVQALARDLVRLAGEAKQARALFQARAKK